MRRFGLYSMHDIVSLNPSPEAGRTRKIVFPFIGRAISFQGSLLIPVNDPFYCISNGRTTATTTPSSDGLLRLCAKDNKADLNVSAIKARYRWKIFDGGRSNPTLRLSCSLVYYRGVVQTKAKLGASVRGSP
jgi:hypothetical protein